MQIIERPHKRIYRDGDCLVKRFDADYSVPDILNEAFNLAAVGETGFRVPRLAEISKCGGEWAIVMGFIEGETLANLIKQNPNNTVNYYRLFVALQHEMHGFTALRLRQLSEKMHTKISSCGLDATTRYELHTRLDGLDKQKNLCHGDFHPHNVIIAPNGMAHVIDWAHATQGNPNADVARTYLTLYLDGKREQAELYLDMYCKLTDTAKQCIQRWTPIVAASQLTKGVSEQRELLLRWTNVVEYE